MAMTLVQRKGGLRRVVVSGAASAARARRQRLHSAVYRFVTSLLLVGASGVASASGANAPGEYLDEETGATVFFVGRPLDPGADR